MINKKRKKNEGFVALISVIIISATLLLIVTTLSYTGFYGRLNVLDSEYKERSSFLAEACADQALLAITNNPAGYTGNATSTISGTDQCYIGFISPSVIEIFETRGIFQNAYTDLKIKVDTTNMSIISWEEIPKF